jgi:thiol-disulfide isomerase/thioredoxin
MRTGLLLVAVGVAMGSCKDATKTSAPVIDPQATIAFITPDEGDVAPLVLRQLAKSRAQNRRLLVYMGATWCEPCRHFHEAVDRGELTGKVGALDLLAFDGDRDAERLVMANYESQFIPAFLVPGPDGKASPQKMEGSVKGSGAVSDIVPRLQALLAK